MSIFVDDTTRVVYQGLTGSAGRFYGLRNREYGTRVVAGTNPRRAGTDVEGIPVFATVAEAVAQTGATASCIFVPAPGVESAVMESAEGGHHVHRGHHRGCARPGRGALLQPTAAGFPAGAPARAELPGHHHAGQVQHRHHRWRDRHAGRAGRASSVARGR